MYYQPSVNFGVSGLYSKYHIGVGAQSIQISLPAIFYINTVNQQATSAN